MTIDRVNAVFKCVFDWRMFDHRGVFSEFTDNKWSEANREMIVESVMVTTESEPPTMIFCSPIHEFGRMLRHGYLEQNIILGLNNINIPLDGMLVFMGHTYRGKTRTPQELKGIGKKGGEQG